MRLTAISAVLLCSLSVFSATPAIGPDAIIKSVNLNNDVLTSAVTEVKLYTKSSVIMNCNLSEIRQGPKINLKMTNIPAREVLRYACIQSGLYFDITKAGVMVVSDRPVMHTQFLKVDIYGGASPEKLKEYFIKGGAEFPEGSQIYYNRQKRILTSVNSVENLRRIRLITINPYSKRNFPMIALNRSVYTIENPVLKKKLDNFTIGPVNLENIELKELLNLLHQASISQDPDKTGINFFLYPLPEGTNTKLNLNLAKMSYESLLKNICSATGLEYKYDDFAVVLRKPEKAVVKSTNGTTEIPSSTAAKNSKKSRKTFSVLDEDKD